MLLLLGGASIATLIAFAITIIFAFAYHEAAHAYTADYLGDPTPRSYGRITLNPVAHLDRVGLLMVLLFGFGWASTPVNPSRLQGNPRVSHALVAVAGPMANLLMALLFALPIRFGLVTSTAPFNEFVPSIGLLLYTGVPTNLLLFAFNLLPIPPLDGFTILLGVLPAELAYRIAPLRQYGILILLAAILLLPRLGFDIIGAIIFPIIQTFGLLFAGRPII